ncbi:MAG: YqiA/YcfP family alpha/beta fold hydrolase [Candidatus Kapaibacterium sp.]
MKIIYLHGLDGQPNEEKMQLLRDAGHDVTAPQIEYRTYEGDIKLFNDLAEMIKKGDYELIIGSSMGGYFGFYLSEFCRVPAVLFNPALHSRTLEVPVERNYTDTKKYLLLGREDYVIPPDKTRAMLNTLDISNTVVAELEMGHEVPVDMFKFALDYIEQVVK